MTATRFAISYQRATTPTRGPQPGARALMDWQAPYVSLRLPPGGPDTMTTEPQPPKPAPDPCSCCGRLLNADGTCANDRFWSDECSGCTLARRDCECN